MKASDDKPGTKKNPIPIPDISHARSNQSYVIEKATTGKPSGKEKSDG